jgi:hypothetical protein
MGRSKSLSWREAKREFASYSDLWYGTYLAILFVILCILQPVGYLETISCEPVIRIPGGARHLPYNLSAASSLGIRIRSASQVLKERQVVV